MADDDQKDKNNKNSQLPDFEAEMQSTASDFNPEIDESDKPMDADGLQYQTSGDDEEYQFEDIEGLGTDADSYTDDFAFSKEAKEGVASPPGRGRFDSIDPKILRVVRNGAFAIGGLVVIVILYKYILSFLGTSGQQSTTKKITAKTVEVKTEKQTPLPIYSENVSTQTTAKALNDTSLSELQQNQSRIDKKVATMETQLKMVAEQVNNISSKMEDMKQTMLVLSERLERQSQQMTRIETVNRPRVVESSSKRQPARPTVQQTVYFIQAVIPGRAWLKSSDGKTITVSQGTMVPGYGAVRTINPKLGRIYTSSGRVIRFDQADS